MARTRNGDRRKTEIGKLAVELRGLTFFNDLPEVRCQLAIVLGKHLIQVPQGPGRRLQSPLFTPGCFDFVLLCFRFKIGHDGATPRNTRTTFDSTLACVEKKATPREIFQLCRSRASSATLSRNGRCHASANGVPRRAYPEGGSDAHSGFGDFDVRDGFDGGACSGPDVRSDLSGLPARVQPGGQLLRMPLHVPASVQRVGIGPLRPVRYQSIFCERASTC